MKIYAEVQNPGAMDCGKEKRCDKELKRKEKGRLVARSGGGTERIRNRWTGKTITA